MSLTPVEYLSLDRTDADGDHDPNGNVSVNVFGSDGLLAASLEILPDGTVVAACLRGAKVIDSAKLSPGDVSETRTERRPTPENT